MTLTEPYSRPELRTAPRTQRELRCVVDDGEIERYTRIWDLSRTGARILTACPPPIGRAVVIRFGTIDGQVVEARGEVIWRSEGFAGRGGVMGVSFHQVSDERAIATLVSQA